MFLLHKSLYFKTISYKQLYGLSCQQVHRQIAEQHKQYRTSMRAYPSLHHMTPPTMHQKLERQSYVSRPSSSVVGVVLRAVFETNLVLGALFLIAFAFEVGAGVSGRGLFLPDDGFSLDTGVTTFDAGVTTFGTFDAGCVGVSEGVGDSFLFLVLGIDTATGVGVTGTELRKLSSRSSISDSGSSATTWSGEDGGDETLTEASDS